MAVASKLRRENSNGPRGEQNAEELKRNRRNMLKLYCAGAAMMGTSVVLLHAAPKLVFDYCDGDRVRAVEILHTSGSLASALEFFLINPVLGSLSDSFGRKVFLSVASIATALVHAGVAKNPRSIALLLVGRVLTKALVPAFFTAMSAAAADMFRYDEQNLADVNGKIIAARGFALVFGPLIGSRFADPNRVPYELAAGLGVVAFLFTLLFRETLPEENRKPFRPRTIHPLSFLSLFTRNALLARLSATYALQTAPQYLGTVQQVYNELRGWSTAMYGNFQSLAGLSAMAGSYRHGDLLRWLGPQRYSVFMNFFALAAFSVWGVLDVKYGAWIGLALNTFGNMRKAAVGARMSTLGRELNFGQGELAAARANLVAVVRVLTPPLFAWLYRKGQSVKVPGLAHFGAASFLALAQLIILTFSNDDLKRRSRSIRRGESSRRR